MKNRRMRDHFEVEAMTPQTWDTVLRELSDENPYTADLLRIWMEPHRGHAKAGLNWIKPDGTRTWMVHATCGQCRRNSAEYRIGED